MISDYLEKRKEKERRWGKMKKKNILCLFLLVVLILVFSSCHPRHVSDIRPNMTKEEVASLWGEHPWLLTGLLMGKLSKLGNIIFHLPVLFVLSLSLKTE